MNEMAPTNVDQVIHQLIANVDADLVFLVIKLMFVFYIVSMLKKLIEHLVSYTLFKKHSYVSLDREVNVDGFEGSIHSITITEITIRNDKSTYVIPLTRWKYSRWIFHTPTISDK